MVELQGQNDGIAVGSGVNVVFELLLLLRQVSGRLLWRLFASATVVSFQQVDDRIATPRYNGVGDGVYGQRPDSVFVVVQRTFSLPSVGVPDLHQAIAASTREPNALLRVNGLLRACLARLPSARCWNDPRTSGGQV